eukprot:9596951-Alexandrium_andersonii.AAC.1
MAKAVRVPRFVPPPAKRPPRFVPPPAKVAPPSNVVACMGVLVPPPKKKARPMQIRLVSSKSLDLMKTPVKAYPKLCGLCKGYPAL